MPVYVHVIDHPDARVLVDTGMTELHPAVADMDPRLRPLSAQDFDLASIDIVVNTHLHFDHCGGNHLFAGRPIYVQRRELDDARSEDDYTIREWVEAPGVRVRARRRRARVASRAPARPGAGPHPRHAGGRRRDGRASGRRRRRHGGLVRRARRAAAPKASCGCARSTPSWSGSSLAGVSSLRSSSRWKSRCGNGAKRARTADLLGAIQALSQLSYSPEGPNPSNPIAGVRVGSGRPGVPDVAPRLVGAAGAAAREAVVAIRAAVGADRRLALHGLLRLRLR